MKTTNPEAVAAATSVAAQRWPPLNETISTVADPHLRRLTQVWTPGTIGEEACANEPQVSELGGAAPYWHEFTYDEVGNRLQEVQHGPGGGITRDYTTPDEGQGPAHAVTQVAESGSTGNSVHSYDYDQAGNMVSRNSGEHDQSLEWGPEGELTKVTGGLSTTEYVYDADGERLLRRTNGATTLYLPGMEVTWDPAAGTEEATRYFTHAGETVAVRENDGRLHWITSDHHGTGEMTIAAIGDEVVQRRMTVFGQDRGTTGTWPGERGFVDGMIDASTGLTQLGARAYEADLGRFISVDPLMDLIDAQSMNGYAYANNSPATYWDGSGLSACIPAEGACMEGGGNTTVYSRESTYGGGSNLTKRTYNFAYSSRLISTSHTYIDGSTNQTFRWSSSSPVWSATTTPTTFTPYTPYTPPPVKSESEKALEGAVYEAQGTASSPLGDAWDSATSWAYENRSKIKDVATLVGFGLCVFASAGACLAGGLALWLGGVGWDLYKNRDDLSNVNAGQHAMDFGLLAVGGVGARVLAGSGRRFMRDTGFSRVSRYQKPASGQVVGGADLKSSIMVYGINAGQWMAAQGTSLTVKDEWSK
ncbi:RHS repeat domain-containing protein [Nocardiopsis valliformis]|uniref:RHS repeat domain-containing protein n=1 Tax=Nocardiopsis valliformis TaxID=239974 RepID=UPI000344D5A0|nr:RHS repeat-associated core domain-containing protein [Nocardiopsis valliformis]